MDFQFLPYRPELKPQWDRFYACHPAAWPGQHSALLEFERLRGHASHTHLVYDNSDRLVAVSPLFEEIVFRDRFFRFRRLVSSTALRGGPLLSCDLGPRLQKQFWESWSSWVTDYGLRQGFDEVRVSLPHIVGECSIYDIFPYFPLHDFGFDEITNLTLIMDLQQEDNELLDRFESVCRKNIRHARREGVEFSVIDSREEWMACEELNRQTFEDQPFPAYDRLTMAAIWDLFVEQGLAQAFGVHQHGQWLCVIVTVGTKFSHYGWIGFNRKPYPVRGANNLLVYEVMRWLRDHGRKYYEIGSFEFDNRRQQQIARFKRRFNAEPRYGMMGRRCLSPVKEATADWLTVLVDKVRSFAPSNNHESIHHD